MISRSTGNGVNLKHAASFSFIIVCLSITVIHSAKQKLLNPSMKPECVTILSYWAVLSCGNVCFSIFCKLNFDIFVNLQLSHVLLDEWKVISTSNFFTEMFLVSHSFKLVISVSQQTFFNNTVGGPVIKLSVEIFTSFEKSLNAQYQIW